MWKALTSATLAIVLMAVLITASIAGTFLGAEDGARYVFTTWWFRSAMALLCLNIVACTLSRGKIPLIRLGSFLTHVSVLLILGGALAGMFAGKKGQVGLGRGEVAQTAAVSETESFPLPFAIRLDDFQVERYKCKPPELTVAEDGKGTVGTLAAKAGQTLTVPTGCQFTVLAYYPDFTMGEGGAISLSDAPNNPAVKVEVREGERRTERYVFSRHPDFDDMHGGAKGSYHLALVEHGDARAKQYKSKIALLVDGKEAERREISVNHPARFQGYTVYQVSYDQEQEMWSGLQVVKDPGVPVVYAGFAVQIIGVVLIIFLNPVLRARSAQRVQRLLAEAKA